MFPKIEEYPLTDLAAPQRGVLSGLLSDEAAALD
jgi:hypothetical protein